MSFVFGLLGGKKSVASQQTAAAGLQVQTSVQGKPIALMYGTTRGAPNLIWYGDFTAKLVEASGAGKGGLTGAGGKGGGGGSYQYSASYEMGLCEGPINGILNVYIDKNVTTLAAAGLSLFTGAYQQTPWNYLLQSQGQIVNELHSVPGIGPFTVTANQPFLYDEGAFITTATKLTYVQGTPAVGQYSFRSTTTQVTYLFNAADNGKTVQINYTKSGVPQSFTGTITGGAVTISGFAGTGALQFRDSGVFYIVGSPLVKVSSGPATGQYSVAGGIYTFNAAQAGAQIYLNYVPNNGQSQALGYSGIAYVAAANYQLGNNPSLSNFNFEVAATFSNEIQQQIQGEQYTLPRSGTLRVTVRYSASFLSDTGVTDQQGNVYAKVANSPGTNQYTVSAGVYTFGSGNAGQIVNISYSASVGPDADPSEVVNDLLTNVHYGAGFPTARVGDLSTYRAYCLATGLVISPYYDTQTAAASMLDELAKATNSAFVWSSGVLKLVPYGDVAVTANGYTYTPPSSPIYSLTDDDFLPNSSSSGAAAGGSSDPVLLTRQRPADAFNSIKLEWIDRGNNYSPAIVEAKDQAAINTFGLRQDSARSFHMFCNGNAARVAVQLQLQRETIRNTYQFTLDQRYVLLDPMDIVAISDSNLGLVNQWVRIREITENDDLSLSVLAEEYLQGTGTAPQYSFQQGQGFNANYNEDPGNVNTPVIFEPTAQLAEALEVWMTVSGGPAWGGCEVWISQDADSYQFVGKISGGGRQGLVDGAIPAFTQAKSGLTIDQTSVLFCDILPSGGQLLSASPSDAQNLATLCYMGSGNDYELFAYATAGFVADSVYNLSYLIRGAYDSPIRAHVPGEQFARIDATLFKYAYTQDRIGTTLYIKLLSFNVYGGGQQGLADVEPFTFVLQGLALSSPLPTIQNLRTSYVAGITQLAWDEVKDFRAVLYEVRKGGAWASAQVLGRVAHPPFNVQGNGTYWVSAYSQPAPGLQVYSEDPESIVITGAQIVSNVIASWDEAATGWTGTFGGSAGLSGGQVVLTGGGNILDDPDYLNTPDIFDFGGIGGSGTYTIPNAHIINIGRVAPCNVIITSLSIGQHVGDNVLTIADYLNFQDLLDSAAQAQVNVYPNIALSQDGTTWGPFQKWTPGAYIAMAYKAQMVLETNDPTVQAILENFVFEVDVPDRDDHYVNQSILSGGTTITFIPDGAASSAPFNGGPQGSPTQPHVQITILNAQQGDTPIISGLSLSGCTVQVKNGGVGVARQVNLLVQGY